MANIPVMIDFGGEPAGAPDCMICSPGCYGPGDIYTHCFPDFEANRTRTGKPSKALMEGRERGIIFDVGHGGGSFAWGVAVPIMKAGFYPDSISTDLHAGSMNHGMKDMLNVMDKFLAMGMPVDDSHRGFHLASGA